MANGQIRGEDIVQESVFEVFARLDSVVAEQIKKINALEAATRKALGGSGIANNANEAAGAVGKSTAALTEQEKVLREINRLRERNTQVTNESLRELAAERAKRSQLTRLLKDETIAGNGLAKTYQQLRKQRDLAANTLRDYIVSQKASNKELRDAQRAFDRLDKKVKKADRAIGNFRDNVGNYGSAVRGVAGFTRQLLGAFGVFSAIQVGQEIFSLVKELDALEFGLREVTETQEAFNQATLFLDRVADRAGADIKALTGRYTNFLAAAKSTTLTLGQTQEIFENVVVAGGVLGRSTDDINGSLRALEQILSKGNVQAEEIRGQLGERLPGAFQILEKALGLATGELNEMLEVGGLLSVDAIPALSKGLEEAFNLDTVDRVETIAAAQARLSNEFARFITQLEEGTGPLTLFFMMMIDFLTLAVKGMAQLTRSQEESDEFFSDLAQMESYRDTLRSIASEADRTGKSLVEVARDLQSDFTSELNLGLARVSELQKELAENPSLAESIGIKKELDLAIAKVNVYQGALRAVVETLKNFQKSTGGAEDGTKSYANTLDGLNEKLADLRVAFRATDIDSDLFQKRKKEVQELEAFIKSLTEAYKENRKAQEEIVDFDSIKFVEGLAKSVEALRARTEVGSAAWVRYGQDLEGVNKRLQELRESAGLLDGDLSSLEVFDFGDLGIAEEVEEFLNAEGLDVLLEDIAKRTGESKEDVIKQFEELYGRDFDKFEEFEKRKSQVAREEQQTRFEIQERALELTDALASAFTEIQLKRLDEEEARQNAVFDNIINNKESSEEAIVQAEKDRVKNEERLAAERAKAEQKAFLFKQALAISEIFIADSIARANAAVAASAAAASAALLGPAAAFKASIAVLGTLQGLISTSTAIALATVAAQTLPQFFYKGKGPGDNYEGPAIWGELRKEVKLSKDGQIEISPDRASPTYVKSSDIILKSLGEFSSKLGVSNSEVSQRVRRGIQRTSDTSLHAIVSRRPGQRIDPDLERILEKAVSRGLSKARLSPKFNIYNDSKIRRVP